MKSLALTQKAIFILMTLFMGFSACAQEIKVMTWNIWHGGLHGPKSQEFSKDTLNTQNVLKVLQESDPDVLFMQETYCCGMELAKEAGYKHSWRSSSNLSIHSKYPIVDTLSIYKPFNSQGVVLNVEGKEILCFNIWLDYLPDTFKQYPTTAPEKMIAEERLTRVKEIKNIVKEIKELNKDRNLPIIIGGDFNSASHLDWVESTKKWHFNKVVDWPVSQVMIQNGYSDSFRMVHPDPTKTMQGTWGYLSDNVISDRIDYIYYKGDALQPKNSKIVMDDPKGGFFNSDHRGILTVFKLE